MPMFDLVCPDGHISHDVLVRQHSDRICKVCGREMVNFWKQKANTVIGDECDIYQENGLAHPRHFRSKAEWRRVVLRENGNAEFVRHTPVPGTDKSPHTTNWSAISPHTLQAAKELLERVGGITKRQDQVESEIQDAVERGEVGVPVTVSDGRTIGIRIGDTYHGVLDHTILKGR